MLSLRVKRVRIKAKCRLDQRKYSKEKINNDQTKYFKTNSIKDTHRGKAPLNKTQVLTKSMNLDIRVVGTTN